MLVDVSVMEQRYQAVIAVVQTGGQVEMADRLGLVSYCTYKEQVG